MTSLNYLKTLEADLRDWEKVYVATPADEYELNEAIRDILETFKRAIEEAEGFINSQTKILDMEGHIETLTKEADAVYERAWGLAREKKEEAKLLPAFEKIAREELDIETLSDCDSRLDVEVLGIRRALKRAYELGKEAE